MAPTTKFPSRIGHIQPGEQVSASTASRPDKTLEGRTNYLREVIESIEAGRALVLRDQSVAPDVLVGQPVYWNEENQRYEQGQAGVGTDSATGMLVPTASSDVTGMVLDKKTGNRADIVLWGVVKFSDLSLAIDGTILPGRYYLSANSPGKLVRQRPPATVSVCVVFGPLDACDDNTWVFVMPQMRDFLEDHIHYSFKLVAEPAGLHTPPAMGDQHVITSPDDGYQGWLPAGHSSFNGKAPTGAKFGYNLSAHPEVDMLWPPIPVTAALLEMFKPDDGDFVGGRVPGSKVQIDQHGIWWMTDCYDEVPWPTNLDTTLSSSSASSESSGSSESATCPHPTTMELCLSFIKMTFATDKTVVTSLAPDEGQPLEYVNCDGEPAATGDLKARLNLELLINADEAYGGQALKGITDNPLRS